MVIRKQPLHQNNSQIFKANLLYLDANWTSG